MSTCITFSLVTLNLNRSNSSLQMILFRPHLLQEASSNTFSVRQMPDTVLLCYHCLLGHEHIEYGLLFFSPVSPAPTTVPQQMFSWMITYPSVWLQFQTELCLPNPSNEKHQGKLSKPSCFELVLHVSACTNRGQTWAEHLTQRHQVTANPTVGDSRPGRLV